MRLRLVASTIGWIADILGRLPERKSHIAWMTIDAHMHERPDTFAIQTRDGSMGVLQVEEREKTPGKLTVRYRPHRGK